MKFEPRWTFTPRMQRQLIAIERTRGFLEAIQLRPDWMGELHESARIKDAFSSIQIEGGSLTLSTAFDLARQRQGKALRGLKDDEREFLNYLDAFDAIDNLHEAKDYRLAVGDILQLHNILLDGVRGGDYFKGQLRCEDVVVGDRVDGETVVHHHPPVWSEVKFHLEGLLEWMNSCCVHPKYQEIAAGAADPWVHPVIAAGIAQHRLVWIHPFRDGNGRTARMFTTLALYLRGYNFKYLFDLSSYYNDNRDEYYAALRSADQSGDYTCWLEYFMGGFSMQMFVIRKQAREAAESVATPSPEESESNTFGETMPNGVEEGAMGNP